MQPKSANLRGWQPAAIAAVIVAVLLGMLALSRIQSQELAQQAQVQIGSAQMMALELQASSTQASLNQLVQLRYASKSTSVDLVGIENNELVYLSPNDGRPAGVRVGAGRQELLAAVAHNNVSHWNNRAKGRDMLHIVVPMGSGLWLWAQHPLENPVGAGWVNILRVVLMVLGAIGLVALLRLAYATPNAADQSHLKLELDALSLTDGDTGLPNRRQFFILAEQELKRSIDDRQRRLLMVLTSGDSSASAMGAATEVLQQLLQASDILARVDQRRFAVLLYGDASQAAMSRARIEANLRDVSLRTPGLPKLLYSWAEFDPAAPVTVADLLDHGLGTNGSSRPV